MRGLGLLLSLLGICGLIFATNKMSPTEPDQTIILNIFSLSIEAKVMHLIGLSVLLVLIGVTFLCHKNKKPNDFYRE